MNTAIMLVEFQNDYYEPNGKAPLANSLQINQSARIAVRYFRDQSLPVIHIQQISTHPDAKYFLPCTWGTAFHPDLQPIKGEQIIKKHYPNAFKDTHLEHYLKHHSIKQLVICGMMTHLAIDATVRAARDLNFHCTILHDACTAKDLAFMQYTIVADTVHHAFLAALHPTYATITSTQDYIKKRERATVAA